MAKIKYMSYTKDNGEQSYRKVLVVAEPKVNMLCYDITDLTLEQADMLETLLTEAETYRDDCLADFQRETGVKINSLWRSFKPEGIEWVEENEI